MHGCRDRQSSPLPPPPGWLEKWKAGTGFLYNEFNGSVFEYRHRFLLLRDDLIDFAQLGFGHFLHCAAAAFAAICSGLEPPAITLAVTCCEASHEIASVSSLRP